MASIFLHVVERLVKKKFTAAGGNAVFEAKINNYCLPYFCYLFIQSQFGYFLSMLMKSFAPKLWMVLYINLTPDV